MKNYYSLLGVDTKATKTEIKKNYRLLANKYHPDKNSDPNAAANFIVITEAYDVLSNKKRRTEYDLMRWEMLKRDQASKSSETIVVQPRESTRTRRNKAQQKRSLQYHRETNQLKKLWSLLVEGFIIASRYVAHVIGVVVFLVILINAYGQLGDMFDNQQGKAIILCLLLTLFIYLLFKLLQLIIEELQKDIEALSIFYRIPFSKSAIMTISIFALTYGLITAVLSALY